jgi:hypothetical protein
MYYDTPRFIAYAEEIESEYSDTGIPLGVFVERFDDLNYDDVVVLVSQYVEEGRLRYERPPSADTPTVFVNDL